MFINYLLIVISTVFFAINMLCNKIYQKNEGESNRRALLFATLTSLFGSVFMIILSDFKLAFTPFSFILALCQTVLSFAYIFIGLKAMGKVNLSLYSLFTMSGGMVLPFLYGIIFKGEDLTTIKVICLALIILALFISCGKISNTKGIAYCIIMFVSNGLFSIIATVHQSYPSLAVSSTQFSFLFYFSEFTICLIALAVLLLRNKEERKLLSPKKPVISLLCALGFLLFNGTGNLILLEALSRGVEASLQYPIVTGGVIIFNTVACFMIGEKPKFTEWISVGISFVGLLLLCF